MIKLLSVSDTSHAFLSVLVLASLVSEGNVLPIRDGPRKSFRIEPSQTSDIANSNAQCMLLC